MQKSGWKQMLRQYGLPFLVLLLLSVLLLLCRSRVRTEFPVLDPQDGVMDVRSVDFSTDVYHLVNRWDYYPGHLYTPQELSAPDAPAKSINAPLDNRLGTWRLVILAQPDIYLSLCSFSIDYGTRVFVNGREERHIGLVSADPAKAVPMGRYMTLPLYSGPDGRIEIVYQYSNHIHKDGGFIQSTLLSTPENIDEYQRGLTLWSLLISGGLTFFSLYFLLNAAFQKSWEHAALALCCAVIALRNQFFFSEHLMPAGYSFVTLYRVMILDVSLIPATAFYLVAAFFPSVRGRRGWAVRSFTALFAVLAVCHFLVETKALVLLCHVCYYVCAPYLVWTLYCLVRRCQKERPGGTDLLTLAAIILFVFMLIWEGVNSGSDSMINHFGLTPLAMVLCILILDAVINMRLNAQRLQLREARQRNELLGQVNEMNRDFLRTVAHELKTPLTVISGYAQLMARQQEKGRPAGDTAKRLDTIRGEADRLAEIVTRLMDYTYSRSREAELGPVDVSRLFENAGAVLSPVCARRGNVLVFSDSCGCRVHGSDRLLLQILINLVVNASRHTENGRITVGTEDCGDAVAFLVRDTGTGIAPEAVPHIFEKGYTTTEGRGIGLSICSNAVRIQGGTLALQSTGPEGSCFRFTIPKEDEQ